MGEALSKFFVCPASPLVRIEYALEMLQGALKRKFIEQQGLMPIEESPDGLAIMCRDPDIIMVGTLRDKKTVVIGEESSLTGHLVFITLHTNSAPEFIIRLLDMDSFNFAFAKLLIFQTRQNAIPLSLNMLKSYVPCLTGNQIRTEKLKNFNRIV